MKCGNCGKEIGVAKFCWSCHAEQEPESDEQVSAGSQGDTKDDEASAPDSLGEASSASGEGREELANASEPPSENGEDGESRKKRRLLYGGLAAAAIAIMAIVAFFAADGNISVRQAGAWPDLQYLATLVDNPDGFVRAANIDDLSSAYNEMKATGDWDEPITVQIDIDEIEQYGKAEEYEGANPALEVRFNSGGTIDYFHMVFLSPTIDNNMMEVSAYEEDQLPLHSLVAFALLGKYEYGTQSMSDEEIAQAITQMQADSTIASPFAEWILTQPGSVLETCGFDLESIDSINEAIGYADWRSGYLRAFTAYCLAQQTNETAPVVMTGMRYDAWFEADECPEGKFFYQAQDSDNFVQPDSFIDVHSLDMSLLCIGFARNGYWEPDKGTAGVEAWAQEHINPISQDLWSFQEGYPAEFGIEGD